MPLNSVFARDQKFTQRRNILSVKLHKSMELMELKEEERGRLAKKLFINLSRVNKIEKQMDTYHPWKGRIATSSSHQQAPETVARYRGYISKNGIIGRYPVHRYSLEQERTAGSTTSGMERCLSRNGVTRNSKADPERSPVNRSSSYAIPFARFQQGSAPKSLLRSIRSCARCSIFTKRSKRICTTDFIACLVRQTTSISL